MRLEEKQVGVPSRFTRIQLAQARVSPALFSTSAYQILACGIEMPASEDNICLLVHLVVGGPAQGRNCKRSSTVLRTLNPPCKYVHVGCVRQLQMTVECV